MLAVLPLLLLGGCAAPPTTGATGVAESSTVETVTVERRDLTSVLVVTGQTVTRPVVALRSPADGAVRVDLPDGARAEEGQVLGSVGDAPVIAPASGEVLSWGVPPGGHAMVDVPVVSFRHDGFGVQAPVPAQVAYRVYADPTTGAASVDGGPAGLSCPVLPADQAPQGSDVPDAGPLEPVFVCLLPRDTRTMAGLTAKVGLQTATATAALVVPVEAVLGSSSTGVVTRVDGDRHEVVDVSLGISDGAMIEITGGLDEGDTVEAVAPGLMARTP